MSRSMASLRRMPASSPSATMFTNRFSTWISTSTFGCRSMNAGSTRAATSATAGVGTESRTRPMTSPGRADTVLRDSRAWSTAAPAFSSRRCPASVSATVREVRVSKVTPRRASS